MTPLPLFDQTSIVNAVEQGAHLPAKREKVKSAKTLQESAVRRDDGIERALSHADRVKAEWRVWAYAYLKGLVAIHPTAQFLAEDLLERVDQEAVWTPAPDRRAWGGIFKALARDRIIEAIGYAKARSSNMSPKVYWRRVESADEAVILNKP